MLKSHMQSVHEGVIFKCDQCTECIVKTKKGWKKHVLSKHPSPEQKANPLLCTEDEYTFMTVADIDMKRHMRETQWRKDKQMQSVKLCIHSRKQFEDTF